MAWHDRLVLRSDRRTLAGPGINYADYATWNAGFGFTYKVLTLDLRYIDTNLNKGNCNAFTGDQNAASRASSPRSIRLALVPAGAVARFVAKLSADLTLVQNVK